MINTLNLIFVYAVLYGLTQKIADLFNEHGLKWFRGSGLIFGILWGVFGFLLVLSNNLVANVILAMNLAYLVRGLLDYPNHQIAATIIFIAFLLFTEFNPFLFFGFFFIFVIFGKIKDYISDVLKKKKSLFFIFNYYLIPTFVYSLIVKDWILFFVFLLHTLSYESVRFVAKKEGLTNP